MYTFQLLWATGLSQCNTWNAVRFLQDFDEKTEAKEDEEQGSGTEKVDLKDGPPGEEGEDASQATLPVKEDKQEKTATDSDLSSPSSDETSETEEVKNAWNVIELQITVHEFLANMALFYS